MYNILEGKNGKTLERGHIRLKAGMDQTGFSIILIARQDTVTGNPRDNRHYVNVLSHRMWMTDYKEQIFDLLLAISELLVMFNQHIVTLGETKVTFYRNQKSEKDAGINFTMEFTSPSTGTLVRMDLRYVELVKLCKALMGYFNISDQMLLEWRAE